MQRRHIGHALGILLCVWTACTSLQCVGTACHKLANASGARMTTAPVHTQSLIKNKIQGVTRGYLIYLRMVGIGYRASVQGQVHTRLPPASCCLFSASDMRHSQKRVCALATRSGLG